MRRRYVSVVGFILVAVLLLAGCTTQPQNAGNTESKSIVIKGLRHRGKHGASATQKNFVINIQT